MLDYVMFSAAFASILRMHPGKEHWPADLLFLMPLLLGSF